MNAPGSLFAEKLRQTRAAMGVNGRMTQEQLAEVLGVSTDAVSKYERSLSYIRGDLEHRLSERLEWGRADVLACREDWERRQSTGTVGKKPYRHLDASIVDEQFGGSWKNAIRAEIAFAAEQFGDLPSEFAPREDTYLPLYDTYRDHWSATICGDQFVAFWSMFFLFPDEEASFRSGAFSEDRISVENFNQPNLPGTYFGYCPAVNIKPGHEVAGSYLLSAFTRYLEDLARREVFFHGLGAMSCSPGGAQLCRQLGMENLGPHAEYPQYENWVLSGLAIANSIFARKSPMLKRAYAKAFG